MGQYGMLWNENWKFLLGDLDSSLEEIKEKISEFSAVTLPHDWLIYDTQNLYKDGCGWYYKELNWNEKKPDSPVFLRFDGVYMDTTVYVNGNTAGEWKYGYSAFEINLAPWLCEGKNEIFVQVRFQAPNSRWYSGAGIYRDVWLKICSPVYLPFDGTYVHTTEENDGFALDIQTELSDTADDHYIVRYSLWKEEKKVGDLGEVRALNGENQVMLACCRTHIHNPKRWDIDSPECYELLVELCKKDNLKESVDSQKITIGFRSMKFTTDEGFFLNGKHRKLHGVCEHHDFGCLGAAFYRAAQERKFHILKQMGCNAIRCSHNMPASELMELADRMGFLVVDEAFDMWERSKTGYDYARFFKQWHERDVKSWIRRDRNHPSLLFWSIGNEIYDTHADSHGQDITRELVRCVRLHDPKINANVTIGSNYMAWENAQKCADIVKYAGYNYGEKYYEEQHAAHPDWIIYGSETSSMVQSRGIYRFPLEQAVLSDEDEQCSCLGNATTSWGARSLDACIGKDRDAGYSLGQFIWSGFDYIGEPTPYHTKNSYFGQIDTAGFPKDSYYVYQAEWTDLKEAPMVHLFPYWDFNPGQLIDMRACSNAPEVELFVNGVSKGRKHINHINGEKVLADWKVAYEIGEVEAVAYDENGNEVAREKHTSFGDSKQITAYTDKTVLKADGSDLCFITVETKDENGNKVENASDYIAVEIEGPGRILGLDNGDSTDYDSYQSPVRKLFSGKLLVVVGSTKEAGDISLKFRGRGLSSTEIRLIAVADKKICGDRMPDEHTQVILPAYPKRIPVRKLELRTNSSRKLSPDNPMLTVEAELYPADTTDNKLIWKTVNAAGIDIGFAKVQSVEEDGKKAVIRALGDGSFYIRCMVQSENKVRLISQLECEINGMGQAFLNPYREISAGLFTRTIGEITNGNEKGIATARDGMSGVVFENIDFGTFGSDTITLPIFALTSDLYEIELWEGEAFRENSRLVCVLPYRKPSQWNVYQAETYKLPARFKGITTISFIMRAKVHLRGFSFEQQEKAYACLTVSDIDRIYGDDFRMEKDAVTGIGNNVTIEYLDMDFGDIGSDTLKIQGYTDLPNNTIQVHFTKENGETEIRILEFCNSQAKEQPFEIEPFKGKGKVELIFLPGSRFNLVSIQFVRINR